MNLEKLKCVVKLGSIKINCIIAEVDENSLIKIIASSSIQSQGIHNGTIVNLSEATKAIRVCVSDAESKANVVLKKINIVFEMPEFVCTRLSKYKKFDGSKIHKEDIDFLLKEAKKEVSLNDSKKNIIHIFNHNYVVDGKEFIKEPIDVYADFMSNEITFISIPKNVIKNINQIFVDCDLEVERFISETFALAVNYFSVNELKFGCTLVDIGYEKTSIGIFNNIALVNSISFPIGINHVSKDISKVCSLSLRESEDIKNQIGCSIWKNDISSKKDDGLPKEFFKNSKYRKISKSLVSEIIIARIKDILEIVKKEVHLTRLKLTSGKKIFFVGGGSYLINLQEFCENFFAADIKIINPPDVNNKPTTNDYIFDSCYGALKVIFYGWETEAIPQVVDKKEKKWGFFSKILGNIT